MTAPRGLIGAALAYWGYALGLAPLGIAAGLGIEALTLLPAHPLRPGAPAAAILRLATAAAVLALAYAAATLRMPEALYAWVRWLPLLLVAFPATQRLSRAGLSPALLAKVFGPARAPPPEAPPVDVTHAYVAICLVAAGAAAPSARGFYPAAALLVGWALLARQPRRRWLPCIGSAAAGVLLGYAIHVGVARLQNSVEEWGAELYYDLFVASADPFRERTRIGDLGQLKLSDRIVLRVVPEGPRPAEILLREAVFDSYASGEWRSAQRAFENRQRTGDAWRLGDGPGMHAVTVRQTLAGGEGLLALPAGARRLTRLDAGTVVESMPGGTTRVKDAPRFIAPRIAYDDEADTASLPGAVDLRVPDHLAAVLDQVIAASRLAQGSPEATIQAVREFFGSRFAYTLYLASPGAGGAGRTLSDFLLRDRQGHCELFATATVLLLRRAGVPARYAVGYSAQEYSDLESAFIVRHRHAHAWAIALVGGRWIAVDTTPSNWAQEEESATRSALTPLLDRISWAVHTVIRWWMAQRAGDFGRWGAIVTAGLLAWLAAGRIRRGRGGAARPTRPDAIARAWLEIDRIAARAGHPRSSGETPREWWLGLQRQPDAAPWSASIRPLVEAYYRARFDPGATTQAVERFIRAARDWRPG